MKLVVSVMPRNFEEAQAIDASRYQDADVIEWRADYLDKNDILQVAPAIFEKNPLNILRDKAILATLY